VSNTLSYPLGEPGALRRIISIIIVLTIVVPMITPAVHAMAFPLREGDTINVKIRDVVIAGLIWDGVKWVATNAFKAACSQPAVAAGIGFAALLGGAIYYLLYLSPNDTAPVPYSRDNCYWNGSYWVCPNKSPLEERVIYNYAA
jgi:hypothetical protein